jgi:hypothetical protein
MDYAIDETKLRAFTGPMYFICGGLSHPRLESKAVEMQTRFPR